MKKVLAVLVAALMIFQSFGVLAAEVDVTVGPMDVVTNIDINAKGGAVKEYTDELEIKVKDNLSFEASIDMTSVEEAFDEIYALLKETAGAASNMIDKIDLTGDFQLKLTYPSSLKLSSSVTSGKNMQGFSSSAIFREVKRTSKVGAEVSELIIDIQPRKNLSVGNVEKFLKDMTFTGSFESVKTVGEFVVTGEMSGKIIGNLTDKDGLTYEGIVKFESEEKPEFVVTVKEVKFSLNGLVSDNTTVMFNGSEVAVENGVVEIEDVTPGYYNLVVKDEETGISKTVHVVVEDKDVDFGEIVMPELNVGSEVVTEIGNVSVKVEETTDLVIESIKDVEVEGTKINDLLASSEGKVVIETKVNEYVASEADIEHIKNANENVDVKVDSLASVTTNAHIYTSVESETKSDSIVVNDVNEKPIELVIPYSTEGKENITVYSKVGDEAPVAIDSANVKIDEDKGVIIITTTNATADFSVAYEEVEKDDDVKEEVTESDDDDEIVETSRPSSGGGTGGGKPSGSFAGSSTVEALYKDVADNHWAYSYIDKMARAGIMNGVGNNKFEPEEELTRAAVVKMLACLVKAEVAQTSLKFVDVPASEWFNPYVAWGLENGVVTGYSETEFAPNKAISRQELSAMIVRFLNKFDVECAPVVDKATFADDALIEAYAYDAIYTLQQAGILNGKGNNIFAPADYTTRAEAAKVFSLVLDLYK